MSIIYKLQYDGYSYDSDYLEQLVITFESDNLEHLALVHKDILSIKSKVEEYPTSFGRNKKFVSFKKLEDHGWYKGHDTGGIYPETAELLEIRTTRIYVKEGL